MGGAGEGYTSSGIMISRHMKRNLLDEVKPPPTIDYIRLPGASGMRHLRVVFKGLHFLREHKGKATRETKYRDKTLVEARFYGLINYPNRYFISEKV